jgi:DNA-binding SARP family transcriptional activator
MTTTSIQFLGGEFPEKYERGNRMMCGVDFYILGPLHVAMGSRSIPIPSGKQRILLATLLLNANEIVSVEELIDRLWDSAVPCRPRSALQTYLTRLRRLLDQHHDGLSKIVHTTAAGYLLEVPPARLDLARFRQLVQCGRAAAERGDPVVESAALTEALSLWRGPVLPDVRSDSLHRDVVPKLTEEWLRTLERRYEVDLALGRHDELVGELRVLANRYPFRERFWRQLMLALYRSDRQVEALGAYREVSMHLREELGIDPSAELRRLHLAILRSDVNLAFT